VKEARLGGHMGASWRLVLAKLGDEEANRRSRAPWAERACGKIFRRTQLGRVEKLDLSFSIEQR
jgi:hypothetical protein